MIVAKETLEHVPQEYIPDILAEFRNIGRAALIIVPLSAVDGIDYIDGVSALDATHVVRWSKNTWITLLEKYGSVSYLPKEIVARISGSNKRLQYKGMLSVRVDFSG
jgi:ABC-type Fe2+-enterobactin transport system substrate-binding protein